MCKKFICLGVATFFERLAWNGFRTGFVLAVSTQLGETKLAQNYAAQWHSFIGSATYLLPLFITLFSVSQRGQHASIAIGSLMLAIGYLGCTLGLGALLPFLIAIVAGRSLFIPNIKALLGGIFAGENPQMEEAAFTRLYIFSNAGTLTGILGGGYIRSLTDNFAYLWLSAISSLVCFTAICAYPKSPQSIRDEPRQVEASPEQSVASSTRLWVILIITFFSALFWLGFEQKTGSLTLFAEEHVNLDIFGFRVPTEWPASINPLFILLLYFPITKLFRLMDARFGGISPITKLSWGLLFLGSGYLILVAFEMFGYHAGIPVFALVMLYLFHTIGEICLEPVGQALVARIAPKKRAAFCLALWDSASFLAILGAGYLLVWFGNAREPFSRYFPIWLFLAVTSLVGGLFLLKLSRPLSSKVKTLLKSPFF